MFNNVCVFKNAQFIMLMLKSYLCFLLNRLRVHYTVGDHVTSVYRVAQ